MKLAYIAVTNRRSVTRNHTKGIEELVDLILDDTLVRSVYMQADGSKRVVTTDLGKQEFLTKLIVFPKSKRDSRILEEKLEELKLTAGKQFEIKVAD